MQASNHNSEETETAISSLNDLVSDESINSCFPFTLDIQQQDNISVEILLLFQELLPSKEGHDRRVKFVNLMEKLLNTEWPDHDIKANVFGSSVNDLGTGSSDVDLCITTSWNGLRNVRLLAKLFRKCGMQHVVCVPRAKVPIVRLFDPELQLSCDINVNNTLALQNTKMIKTYVALDPRVRPLIMTIKHWTKQRLLNDAANGGTLSSYTWTCMIINFLQQRDPPILPVLHLIENEDKDEDYFFDDIEKLKGFGAENHESLGGLLYAFFRRFAIEFDYDDQVISVRQGRYLTKKEKGWDTGRNKISLCVEEPFNVGRNLGNSADVASVCGLRCEFQRFLDLLLAGESLDKICTPYQPISFSTTEIPVNTNFLSLTLPIDNRTPSYFLPHSDSTAHPFDRRRSMVDGIYSYIPSESSNKPTRLIPNTFHPRVSSSQALDSIMKSRNTRHGSHPLPPVPSRLLSMLNISANHGTEHSVDQIFARYNNRQQSPPHVKKNNHYRRKPMNGNIEAGESNSNQQRHHHRPDKKPRRKSSVVEWPSITPSSSQNKSTSANDAANEQPQRSRRWSTIKKNQIQAAANNNMSTDAESSTAARQKKPTLAEIVKVHIPSPSMRHKTPPTTPVPSTSSSSTKSHHKNRKQKNNNSKPSNSSSTQNKQRKKHNKRT